jgi:drug/metabolite transporter (DMT)-like permease/NAD-dependent dihydropyrimidine dehydrogenase PreA subunit
MPPHRDAAPDRVGLGLCLVSAAGFGSLAVFGKQAYAGGLGVVGVLAVRFLLAAPLLVGLALAARRRLRVGWPVALRLLGLGGIGYAIQATLFFNALTRISAGLAGLLLYLYPALVTAGAVALGRTRLERATVAGLVLSLSGIVLVLGLPGERLDGVGVALGLASAGWYTCYILVGEYLLRGVDPLVASAYVSSGAAGTFLAAALVAGGRGLQGATRPAYAAAAAMALVGTALAIATFLAGMARVGSSWASIASSFEPVFTVALGVAVLGDPLGPGKVAGGLLVVAGAVLLPLLGGTREKGRIEPATGVHAHEGVHPKMTYVITEPCIDVKDKSCIEECPVDCIYEGDRMLYIHPDECVDCGACEPVCPVEAIFYEDDVPAQWKDFTATNAAFFTEGDDPLGSPGGAAKVGPLVRDTQYVANYTPTE